MPVRPWKYPGGVGWRMEHVRDPSSHRNDKSLDEASEHVKPEIESLLFVGSHPSAMASCSGDKTSLHRQDQKRWLGQIRHVMDLRRSGVNGLTHVTPKVILPRVKDFAISVVDLLVASDKSNLSGIGFGCIDYSNAFHTLTVREHEDGHLGAPAESPRSALPPPVSCCGSAFQHVWSVNVPVRGAQSSNVCGRPCVDFSQDRLSDDGLSLILLLFWAAMGANLPWEKGTYCQCIDWTTPRFQCSLY